MKYLLDTCVLSDFVKGEPNTIARVKEISPELVSISIVTAMEIEFGLALNAQRARKLAPLMREIFEAITIFSYEMQDARATATLRAALQKKGRPIGAYDVLIAGCALARGLILVTSNESEFSRVSGLKLENWRKA